MLSYVNAIEVFHHLAKQEIDFKTIDVAELEEKLEALKMIMPKMMKLPKKMILVKMMTLVNPLKLSVSFSMFV